MTPICQWGRHVNKYSNVGDGIPIIYKLGEGITDVAGVGWRLHSGAGGLNGLMTGYDIASDYFGTSPTSGFGNTNTSTSAGSWLGNNVSWYK
jgi:hypothetical protein